VQTCILHLIRHTFRYAARQHWDELARDLRPVYTAPNAEMAAVRFADFADKWGTRYPAIIKLWQAAWEQFIPFLDYDVEIRKILCSTNAGESPQPPLPPSGARPGPLPNRPSRAEMPLPRHPLAGSHRARQDPPGDALETRTQRRRHHLRRPYRPQHPQLTDYQP
jgi:hypothetical protein